MLFNHLLSVDWLFLVSLFDYKIVSVIYSILLLDAIPDPAVLPQILT